MQNQEIHKQLQKLNDLIQRTQSACHNDFELQSHWAKYICILSAGLLENALKELYSDYAKKQVSQPVANFVSSNLSHIRSPKMQKFLEIAAAFKEDWKDELENYVNSNGRTEAVDSIMNNRHLIAHGKNHNSNISLAQIKDYLNKAKEVLVFIETQCSK